MSNTNKPLTAEEFVKYFFGDSYCTIGLEERDNLHSMLNEFAAQQTATQAPDNKFTGQLPTPEEWYDFCVLVGLSYDRERYDISRRDLQAILFTFAAQQNTSLREELQELSAWKKSQLETFGPLLDFGQSKESGIPIGASIVQEAINALKERKVMREELEAVKKERDSLKGTATKSWIALNFERHEHKKVRDQRDEAVKLLDIAAIYHVEVGDDWQNKYAALKRGLSSGETKSPEIPDSLPDDYPGKEYQPLFDHMQKEHNVTLLTSQMDDIIHIVGKMDSPWISVEDRPLFNKTGSGWVCTPDGSNDFIAAVSYTDAARPGEDCWWIRHCVIEDETGLCVVGDDDNQPAGWELEDVEYWMPLPAPPESLTDKTE